MNDVSLFESFLWWIGLLFGPALPPFIAFLHFEKQRKEEDKDADFFDS